MKVDLACHLLHADFLLGLFSDPEDLDDTFLESISYLSVGYIKLDPRRYNS
jgi:hypothetical protein